MKYKQTIKEIRKLKPNWDSYGARSISDEALLVAEKAIQTLTSLGCKKEPTIIPTPEGFVQLEWYGQDRYLEFEYTSHGWGILGTEFEKGGRAKYNEAMVSLSNPVDLLPFYSWFEKRSEWTIKGLNL